MRNVRAARQKQEAKKNRPRPKPRAKKPVKIPADGVITTLEQLAAVQTREGAREAGYDVDEFEDFDVETSADYAMEGER